MFEVPPINCGTSATKKNLPWGWLILIVLVSLPIVFLGSLPIIPIYIADSGFRKAKATINPEDLRLWAFEAAKKYSSTDGFANEIPSSEIPPYIKKLYSNRRLSAWVNPKTSDSEGCVMIMWGGGFFSWDFDIGSTNFLPHANPEYPHNYMLAPGIYYRREAAWPLL